MRSADAARRAFEDCEAERLDDAAAATEPEPQDEIDDPEELAREDHAIFYRTRRGNAIG